MCLFAGIIVDVTCMHYNDINEYCKRNKFCHINGLRHAKREGRKTKKTFIDVLTLKAKGNEDKILEHMFFGYGALFFID